MKPALLSKEDIEKFSWILSDEPIEVEKSLVKYHFKYLTSSYEILNFDLDSLYIKKGQVHVSEVFIELLDYLTNITDDEKEAEKYVRKQIKYVEYQLDRLNKKFMRANTLIYTGPISVYYLKLIMWYREINDNFSLAKTYQRYIQFYYECTYNEPDIFNDDFDELFPEELQNLLSDNNFQVFIYSPQLMDCITKAMVYADDSEPVLIYGETGTGKELIAKIIHYFSKRFDNNFKAINCTAISETLFESEIFGVISGAATDVKTRLGAFLSACGNANVLNKKGYRIESDGKERKIKFFEDGKEIPYHKRPDPKYLKKISGTLFLDEINSIPNSFQAKLLRVIQENELQVIGEDITRPFSVKIICAINRKIEDINADHEKFRKDLYYRINKGYIELPPLRDLLEEFPLIVKYKLNQISDEINSGKKIRIDNKAIKKLQRYSWPGNFRELENVLYRSAKAVSIENRTVIVYNDIEELDQITQEKIINIDDKFLNKSYDEVEKEYMEYLFGKANGNISKVVRLGRFKNKSPVYRILRKHSIIPPKK